jgi:hypothetical protein
MATETDYYKHPCLCGKGEIEIQKSSPDHPFASSYAPSYSGTVLCPTCSQTHVFGDDGVLLRSEVAAMNAAKDQHWAAYKKLDGSQEASAIRKEFGEMLDSLKTKKAVHTLVTKSGLNSRSYGSFIKNYAGGQHYARGIMLNSLPKALEVLGKSAPAFEAELAKVQQLHAAIPKPKIVKPLAEFI